MEPRPSSPLIVEVSFFDVLNRGSEEMKFIKEQIQVIKERDPAIKSTAEVFLYPSFYAILCHKVSHKLYKRKWYFLARLISQIARGLTGIEIHPGAVIGKGLFIDHGMGVVIGETCEIGDNVTIYHQVTLGGTGKDHGKRHPTIGNNVMISTGAKILGPFKVGNNSRIAANAVVLQEVPEDSTVVGIPGRVVKIKGEKVNPCSSLDQVKIPDPVQMQLCKLKHAIEKLGDEVDGIKSKEHTHKMHTEHCMIPDCLGKGLCDQYKEEIDERKDE